MLSGAARLQLITERALGPGEAITVYSITHRTHSVVLHRLNTEIITLNIIIIQTKLCFKNEPHTADLITNTP